MYFLKLEAVFVEVHRLDVVEGGRRATTTNSNASKSRLSESATSGGRSHREGTVMKLMKGTSLPSTMSSDNASNVQEPVKEENNQPESSTNAEEPEKEVEVVAIAPLAVLYCDGRLLLTDRWRFHTFTDFLPFILFLYAWIDISCRMRSCSDTKDSVLVPRRVLRVRLQFDAMQGVVAGGAS